MSVAANVETSSGARLRLALSRVLRTLRRHGESSLTASQVSALSTLEDFGAMRISTIAGYESLGAPAATRVVASLEELGLVLRTSDPDDKRASLIELTDLDARTPHPHRARHHRSGVARAGEDCARLRVELVSETNSDSRDPLGQSGVQGNSGAGERLAHGTARLGTLGRGGKTGGVEPLDLTHDVQGDVGDAKATGRVGPEANVSRDDERFRRTASRGDLRGERHGEARRVGRGDQLFGAGPAVRLVGGPMRERDVKGCELAAHKLYFSGSVLEAAGPGGARCTYWHLSSLRSCCSRHPTF
jgi:hypothetical protein